MSAWPTLTHTCTHQQKKSKHLKPLKFTLYVVLLFLRRLFCPKNIFKSSKHLKPSVVMNCTFACFPCFSSGAHIILHTLFIRSSDLGRRWTSWYTSVILAPRRQCLRSLSYTARLLLKSKRAKNQNSCIGHAAFLYLTQNTSGVTMPLTICTLKELTLRLGTSKNENRNVRKQRSRKEEVSSREGARQMSEADEREERARQVSEKRGSCGFLPSKLGTSRGSLHLSARTRTVWKAEGMLKMSALGTKYKRN